MQRQLRKEWFEEYFFYGLENKDEIVKWIIINGARQIVGTHKELDVGLQKMNYEKDQETMLELIVQLERFTSLHDDPSHREYFYDNININSTQIHQIFNRIAEEIRKTGALSFVRYRPVSGIFYNAYEYKPEIPLYSGEQYYNKLKQESNGWDREVYEVLCYLSELEKENRIEYYSLFLDSKYARAINRYKDNMANDEEIHEIRGVYRKFLESRSIAGSDLKAAIESKRCKDGGLESRLVKTDTKLESTSTMSREMIAYIDKHYPDYNTITTLKKDAIGNKYKQRLDKEAKKVCDLFLKEKNMELEFE